MSQGEVINGEIQSLMSRGLRNVWYPVLASWALHNRPLGITRLSENLVLWRDENGEAHALEDRCPHRGARLSLGWNLGNRLACCYHGVEVNAEGMVVDVPAVAHCSMVGKKCVRAYQCQESNGAIFVYFGDELHTEPPQLILPEGLSSPEYDAFLCTARWKCNYRYAVENVVDVMHGTYLHAVSHSMAQGNRQANMRARPTETGFVLEKKDQRDVNFDWVEFGETGAMWLRLEIPYKRRFGPGGNFGIVGFVTPVDENHCQVFFWRTRKTQGWKRDVWRFMYKNRLEGLHWAVLEQDRVVLEHLAPNARDHETLYQHDAGVVLFRKTLWQRAEDQIKALNVAKTAVGK